MSKALIAVALAAALAATLANPAAAPAPDAAPLPPNPADWRPLDPANTLVIDTTKGRIIVEMHPELAPAHVTRIKTLARGGYYNESLFYRVPAFAAQGGDKNKTFRSPLPNLKDEFFFQTGPTTPFVSFGTPTAYQAGGPPSGDQGFIGALPVVTDAATPPGQPSPPGRGSVLFCPGVASLAHGSAPDSANSQVFFMKVRGTNLEKAFTAWGRVVQGQDVVAMLNAGEPPPMPDRMTRVRIMADMPAAERPTVQVMDTRSATFAAMVQAAQKAKGPGFTLCDVEMPTKPN